MSKHIWEWDKKSHNPMIVVCTRCGKRMPLSIAVSEGAYKDCPGKSVQEAVQEELFVDRGVDRKDEPKD